MLCYMTKFRKFCVVFHNVREDCKPHVEAAFQQCSRLVLGVEPYPHQDGFHLHMFIDFGNPRSFKSVLDLMINVSKGIIVPRPAGTEGDWGRVQVDSMRGSWDQAVAYLVSPNKDKPLDPSVRTLDLQKIKLFENFMISREFLRNSCFYDVDIGDYNTPWLKYKDLYDSEPYSVPDLYYNAFFHYYNFIKICK